jgi:hypothetical protein
VKRNDSARVVIFFILKFEISGRRTAGDEKWLFWQMLRRERKGVVVGISHTFIVEVRQWWCEKKKILS